MHLQFLIFSFLWLILLIEADALNDEFKPLRPRQAAPSFKAKAVFDDKFIDVSLSQYTSAGKWVRFLLQFQYLRFLSIFKIRLYYYGILLTLHLYAQ